MRLIFLATLVVLLQVQQPGPTVIQREEPDVVVQKFTWEIIRANSDLIHSAMDPGPTMNEPVGMVQSPRANEPQELKNRRDMNERRADMAAARNAAQSNPPRQDQYLLHLEVRNVGTNVIKSIVWEYQPSSQTTNYELRQYVCTMKAKPKDSKTFELLSPYHPLKVVQADAKTGEPKDGKVVINRIEYADGSIWKRKGWSVIIPPDMTGKMGNGKCLAF